MIQWEDCCACSSCCGRTRSTAAAATGALGVDSPETNARFAQSLGLDYQVLSDPAKDVARACGVLSATGFAWRRTFLIGADGRIPGIDKRVSPARRGRDVAEALKSACRTVN